MGRCDPCTNAEQYFGQLPDVLIIAMVVRESPLYNSLIGYKKDWSDGAQTRHIRNIGATVAAFVRSHKECIGTFDVVTAIPSETRIALEPAIDLIVELRDRYRPLLRTTGPKSRTPTNRFTVTADVAGQRVLVIDDTFASGSTLFAACDALTHAGAQVVGPLVIGRLLNPAWSGQLITTLSQHDWTLKRCSRCDPLFLHDANTLL
jgi:hypothetical protein